MSKIRGGRCHVRTNPISTAPDGTKRTTYTVALNTGCGRKNADAVALAIDAFIRASQALRTFKPLRASPTNPKEPADG